MNLLMAEVTNGDQVLLRVLTGVTPEPLMVHFEVGHCPAELASPAVALQYGSTQLVVLLTFQAIRA